MGQEPTAVNPVPYDDPDMEVVRHDAQRKAYAERSDDPEAIRQEIADTRADMEGTIEAINDRVNPQRVYERRSGKARQRWESIKGSIMGSDDDDRFDSYDAYGSGSSSQSLSDRTPDVDVSGRARQARQTVAEAPDAAARKTRGNPIAAGMIAFGIGALIGGAMPETEAEREAVREADRHLDLEGTKDRLAQRGQEVGEGVKSSAQAAAQDLKGSAQDRAQDVKQTAQEEGERVKQDAQDSAERVKRES